MIQHLICSLMPVASCARQLKLLPLIQMGVKMVGNMLKRDGVDSQLGREFSGKH